MKIRTIATLGLSALVFGGTMVGCTQGGGIASASSRSDALSAKQAAVNAAKASKALGKGDATTAVSFAEAAVGLQPNDPGYRALLAQSYMKAGRFTSAEAGYADLLVLSPANGKAALNLALAQIATGEWAAARKTLDAHATEINVTDRGLAIALAGDPGTAVDLLTAATRSPDATAKTRHNLALAMALAGRWKEAHAVVSTDLAPADADKRIMQWATFAKPAGAADQVATLLGVKPASDPGQPVALALNRVVPVATAEPKLAAAPVAPIAVAITQPVAVPVPVVVAAQPVPVVAPTATPAPATSADASSFAGVKFAERREIVQAIPVSVFRAAKIATIKADGAFRHRITESATRVAAKGDWFVQIGAFSSAGVAKDAWSRAQRRFAAFDGKMPHGAGFKSSDKQFYRLSIGGFSRADADSTCRAYRATGGVCFVRPGAGDQMAQWLRPGTQLASR